MITVRELAGVLLAALLMRELESPPYTYDLRVIKRSPH